MSHSVGSNLHHDTDYTEVFRGSPQSSGTFFDTTINYATIFSPQTSPQFIIRRIADKSHTNKHRKCLPWNEDPGTCEQFCG